MGPFYKRTMKHLVNYADVSYFSYLSCMIMYYLIEGKIKYFIWFLFCFLLNVWLTELSCGAVLTGSPSRLTHLPEAGSYLLPAHYSMLLTFLGRFVVWKLVVMNIWHLAMVTNTFWRPRYVLYVVAGQHRFKERYQDTIEKGPRQVHDRVTADTRWLYFFPRTIAHFINKTTKYLLLHISFFYRTAPIYMKISRYCPEQDQGIAYFWSDLFKDSFNQGYEQMGNTFRSAHWVVKGARGTFGFMPHNLTEQSL